MKKLLLLSALLIISIFGYTQTAITNANIQTAVDLWDSDLSAATTTYSNITVYPSDVFQCCGSRIY